jgi:lipid-A-disaccharide synthase
VVAGEGSGDLMAAAVVGRVGVCAFGWGGERLRAVGMETLLDVAELGVMGMGAAMARKLPAIVYRGGRLLATVRRRRPAAALLVGFSELNCWLGRRLRRQGIPVLWYGPPQIWAWRKRRGHAVKRAADRLAVLLPFEQELWQRLGADVVYVGHPALEATRLERADARKRLGATHQRLVALLPGSRAQEVRRHLPVLLCAADRLRTCASDLESRVLVAPALPASAAEWVARTAQGHGVQVLEDGTTELLSGFDLAAVASGTATLQCAVAGVPPVIVYRTELVSAWVVRRLLRVPCVGLPNLVLGQPAFPELLQHSLHPVSLSAALCQVLDRRAQYLDRCRRVRTKLELPGGRAPSCAVAELLEPWLD